MSSEETARAMANEAREDAEQGGYPEPVAPVAEEGAADRVPEVDGEEDLPGVVYGVVEGEEAPGEGAGPEAPEEAPGGPEEPVDEAGALREELERVSDELGAAQADLESARERNRQLSEELERMNGLALTAERYEQKGARRFLDSLDQMEAIRAQAMQALSMQTGAADAPQGG